MKTKSAPSNLQNPYILTKFNSLPLFVKKTLKILEIKNNCNPLNSFYLNPITFQHHHFLPKTNLFSNYEKYIYILKVVIQKYTTQHSSLTKFNSLPLFVKKKPKNSGIKNNCTLNSFYLNPTTLHHHHFSPKTNLQPIHIYLKSSYPKIHNPILTKF